MTITLLIIALSVLVSVLAWNGIIETQKLTLHPVSIYKNKQWYRLFTHGFIHADFQHLLFNMFTLYFFGSSLENYLQYIFECKYTLVYILLYASALMFADFYHVFKYRTYAGYHALGASGAVSAILFAYIFLNPLDKIYIFFIPIGIPGFLYGLLYLIYCQYSHSFQTHNRTNHLAHFIGAVYGILYIAFFYPQSFRQFFAQIKDWSWL